MKCPKCGKEFGINLIPFVTYRGIIGVFISDCCNEDLITLVTEYKLKLKNIEINTDRYEEYMEEMKLAT